MSEIDWESLTVDQQAALTVEGWEYLPVDIVPILGTIYSITVVGDHINTTRFVDVVADFVSNTPAASITASAITFTQSTDVAAHYITETKTTDVVSTAFDNKFIDVYLSTETPNVSAVVGDHVNATLTVNVDADFVTNIPSAGIVMDAIANIETTNITASHITETEAADVVTGAFSDKSVDVIL